MALADLVVVGIMTRRDLERACAKLRVDIFVGDDGDFAAEDGHDGGLAHQVAVTFVVGVDGDGGVAQDGLGARGADLDEAAVGEGIAEGVEVADDLFVLDFEVADGAGAARTPVDQVVGAVDQALFIEPDKGVEHGFAEAVVQRKALALPVTRDAHALLLGGDAVVVFVFPVPHFAHKLLRDPSSWRERPCSASCALDDVLRGDAGVVRAGDPQRGLPDHAMIADEHVLDGVGDGVAQVQRAGDVGGRHGDDKRVGAGLRLAEFGLLFGREIAVGFPPVVERLFHDAVVVGFGHVVVGHIFPCSALCSLPACQCVL